MEEVPGGVALASSGQWEQSHFPWSQDGPLETDPRERCRGWAYTRRGTWAHFLLDLKVAERRVGTYVSVYVWVCDYVCLYVCYVSVWPVTVSVCVCMHVCV